jgi:hypothetical protein
MPHAGWVEHNALRRSQAVGSGLAVFWAIAAWLWDPLALHALFFGSALVAAAAGYIYARLAFASPLSVGTGGAIAGATCGLFGAAASIVLGDGDPGQFIPDVFFTLCAGACGGLAGLVPGDPARASTRWSDP